MNRALQTVVLALALSLVVTTTAADAKAGGVPAVPLTTGQETGEVVSDGSGSFSYVISGNELCYTLTVHDLTGAPVAAHIHIGARNVAGPVVVALATPPGASSSVSACITATEGGNMTPAELAAIAANPRAYYVNVHTPTYPGGEVRGQLK
jgi:hypothetical protein